MIFNRAYFNSENCECLISILDEQNFYDIQETLFSFGYYWYSGYNNHVQKIHSYKDNEYTHIYIEYNFKENVKKIISYPLGGKVHYSSNIYSSYKNNTPIATNKYYGLPVIDGIEFVKLNRRKKLQEIFNFD